MTVSFARRILLFVVSENTALTQPCRNEVLASPHHCPAPLHNKGFSGRNVHLSPWPTSPSLRCFNPLNTQQFSNKLILLTLCSLVVPFHFFYFLYLCSLLSVKLISILCHLKAFTIKASSLIPRVFYLLCTSNIYINLRLNVWDRIPLCSSSTRQVCFKSNLVHHRTLYDFRASSLRKMKRTGDETQKSCGAERKFHRRGLLTAAE